MPAVYYESYQPNYAMAHNNNHGAPPPPPPQHHKEEDTQQAASLLLLLGRSVTPDPQLDDSDHSSRSRTPHLTYSSPFGGAVYAYESVYSDRSPMPSSSSSSPYARKDKQQHQEDTNNSKSLLPPASAPSSTLLDANIDYESLIEGSKLVLMKDQDLVPDCLFVAMAQMKPCRLTHADRVGCYKAREIGFLGMCCKHCGGQPGFGRYYPNSVRSLAQTTTSQTILKHIGNKCRFCPPHIRNAVLQLQQQSNLCEGTSSGRPRYGSRKIFFQRVWQRLHGGESAVDEDDSACSSTESTPAFVEESTSSVSSTCTEEETAPTKRKNRFGTLPLQKNKRAKTAAPPQMPV